MKKIPASVVILTHNSAATLQRALESVRDFEDIVVCDGGSSDQTIALAELAGARVTSQAREFLHDGMIADFAGVRNAALQGTRYDWVLMIDSDESASTRLVDEIRSFLTTGPEPAACRIPAGIILDDREIQYSSNYPGYQVRFFNKAAGEYRKPIHERFVPLPEAEIVTFTSPWHYYISSKNFGEEFEKDLERDMGGYETRYRGQPLSVKCTGMYRALRSVVGILLRSLHNKLLHPGSDSMPLYIEFARVRYQLLVIRTILRTMYA